LLLAGFMGLVHALIWTRQDPEPSILQFGLLWEGWNPGLIWRGVTYAFVHGNGVHLALNLTGLLIIGPKVERIGGGATLLRVFFAGALIGGAAHLVLAPPGQQGIPLVGASGGIMALLLWLTTTSPDAQTWPIRVSGRSLGLGVIVAEACLLTVAWGFPHASFQPVAHACHLGGALVGWGMARRLLRPSPTLEDLRKERARRESADGP
jgi:membrane associated rhomboid family serine protease